MMEEKESQVYNHQRWVRLSLLQKTTMYEETLTYKILVWVLRPELFFMLTQILSSRDPVSNVVGDGRGKDRSDRGPHEVSVS